MPIGWAVGASLFGGMMQADATSSAAASQAASDRARLEEEKRVREQLRADTEAQRTIADKAYKDYAAGLITEAEAKQRAGEAIANVQKNIASSQLSDVEKTQEMTRFQPYGIRTGTGSTYVDQTTGQAGYNLSPELQKYQESLYGNAATMAGNLATSPEAAAKQYYEQQQGLLTPTRQAEDIALRQQQLKSGRIGLGLSGEAMGAGAGTGMVNPEQYQRDLARARADAQLAADATQKGITQQGQMLDLTKGMFSAGAAPETVANQALTTGLQYGNSASSAGYNQANLYNQGMTNYYNSMLGGEKTFQDASLAVPAATQVGLTTGYNREQQYLSNLQGNPLPYQPMTTPSATVPGSAYMNAAIGNQLMNFGGNALNNYMFNQQPNYGNAYATTVVPYQQPLDASFNKFAVWP